MGPDETPSDISSDETKNPEDKSSSSSSFSASLSPSSLPVVVVEDNSCEMTDDQKCIAAKWRRVFIDKLKAANNNGLPCDEKDIWIQVEYKEKDKKVTAKFHEKKGGPKSGPKSGPQDRLVLQEGLRKATFNGIRAEVSPQDLGMPPCVTQWTDMKEDEQEKSDTAAEEEKEEAAEEKKEKTNEEGSAKQKKKLANGFEKSAREIQGDIRSFRFHSLLSFRLHSLLVINSVLSFRLYSLLPLTFHSLLSTHLFFDDSLLR